MKENEIVICGHGSNHPTTKNMYTYLEGRYRSVAKNGKRKGLVCVRRLKNLNEEGRKSFKNTYATILGRNIYSQPLREYVYTKHNGCYYSDCSSSGMATYAKIGVYKGVLLNTAGIYTSPLFETVNVKIVNGHVTNPEVLKVGDALLFAGEDPSRPLQIGHVEYVFKMPSTKSESKDNSSSTKYDKIASEYKVGKTYLTVVDDLNVRESVGGRVKSKKELTPNAQKYSNAIGQLKKGVAVTCQDVKVSNDTVWMKIPSGWICAYNKDKYYVKGRS